MSDPVETRGPEQSGRVCDFCKLPIPDAEKAIQAVTRNGWRHFECWYDGSPFKRDPETGVRCG